MQQLLIVDAEEDLLWALSKNLYKDRKGVKVRTAATGEDALEILRNHSVDVLVTDTRVGGEIDGFNLILRAKDQVPGAKLVVMTAFSTETSPAFEPSLGIAHFINKPFDTADLRKLIDNLLEDGDQVRGLMSDLSLADIIALLCLCGRTVLLHLNHRGRRGRFEVVDGDINHAEFDDLSGPEAAWTMLGLKQGDIFMQSDFPASEPSVEMPWQQLLGEAKAWLDEHGLPEEPEPEVDIPVEGWDEEGLASPLAEGDDDDDLDENPLGFSEEDLREIAEAELPNYDPARAEAAAALSGGAPAEDMSMREEAMPRAPILRPKSDVRDGFARRDTRSTVDSPPTERLGQAALSLEEIIAAVRDEVPAFVAVDIVHVDEGASIAGAIADDARANGFDGEAAAAFYGEVVRTGIRAASAFGDAALEAVQICTGEHYVLGRMVPESPYAQIVTMERSGNLGIAQVVMRRLDPMLANAVPR